MPINVGIFLTKKKMIKADNLFLTNINQILNHGVWDNDPRPKYRDGVPAKSKYITQVFETYDLSLNEFPITTLRKTAIKKGISEILWIYQKQSSSLVDARNMGVDWWEDWNIGGDTIGQRYGATVKKWGLMDKLLNSLKTTPYSRSQIINLYQESDLIEPGGLNPCAYETIWSVRNVDNEYYLDVTLIQRSSDYLVANFINKSQYCALMMMVANSLGYKLGKFCHFVQNLHIYDRHFEAANELITNFPKILQPKIILPVSKNFYDYSVSDFYFENTKNLPKLNSSLEIAI